MSALKITSRTSLYGIIGSPIEHSLSPIMQNAAFRAVGLDAVYVAFRVEPSMLRRAIDGFRAINLSGFNVTIPHKVSCMKYLDEMDSSASTIGAVNAVVNFHGNLKGYNTDGIGAIGALREAGIDPHGKKVLLLGAGGAARALAFTLAEIVDRIVILNRTVSRARDLAEDVGIATNAAVTFGRLDPSSLSEEIVAAEILVNATSVGMYPRPGETPVDKRFLRSDLAVFDIVYNPLETRLLREAGEKGAKRVSGLMMLVYQGVQAFELWTGKKAPHNKMANTLKAVLEARSVEEAGT